MPGVSFERVQIRSTSDEVYEKDRDDDRQHLDFDVMYRWNEGLLVTGCDAAVACPP